MRITMVGSGYVGLVSAACLADFGHDVTCIDTDAGKIVALGAGRMPIFEPGLADLVRTNVAAGRLRFTTDLAAALLGAEVAFLAVGTPSRRGDGHADLGYLHAAVREIASALRQPLVLVTKSTVPVGTGDDIAALMAELRPDLAVPVVANPEFLREGAAIADFTRPDRIVLGIEDEAARPVMEAVYHPLAAGRVPLVVTSRRSAELIKYAANAFLAMKVSFINEVADLCERTGATVDDVAAGIGLDQRIGMSFLRPGPGYGGSCFPKDTLALARTATTFGAPMRLVETTIAVNHDRKQAMAGRIIDALGGTLEGRTIAVLGLTFKPDTDDMRAAPALDIIPALQAAGARVRAYDPEGMPVARTLLSGIDYGRDAYDAARGANALVLLTEWNAFRSLDLARLRAEMAGATLIDLRNVYDPAAVRAHGFTYRGIGRSAKNQEGDGAIVAA